MKTDGTLRMCIDYRKASLIIAVHHCINPSIEDLSRSVAGHNWISTVDLVAVFTDSGLLKLAEILLRLLLMEKLGVLS